MFRSPCKIPAMKRFEQKNYGGLKPPSYNVKINHFGSTEVACQLQRFDSAMIWPVNTHEALLVPSKLAAPPAPSKPVEPVTDHPLVSKHFFFLPITPYIAKNHSNLTNRNTVML